MKSIGLKIKEIRLYQKMSQDEFAAKIGISRSSLSQIEIGKAKPTYDILYSIANSFCIRGTEFFSQQDENDSIQEVKANPDKPPDGRTCATECKLCGLKDQLIKSQQDTIDLLREKLEKHQCPDEDQCQKNEKKAG
jgi:transcriptional regulator with XRE-family HTH domain